MGRGSIHRGLLHCLRSRHNHPNQGYSLYFPPRHWPSVRRPSAILQKLKKVTIIFHKTRTSVGVTKVSTCNQAVTSASSGYILLSKSLDSTHKMNYVIHVGRLRYFSVAILDRKYFFPHMVRAFMLPVSTIMQVSSFIPVHWNSGLNNIYCLQPAVKLENRRELDQLINTHTTSAEGWMSEL